MEALRELYKNCYKCSNCQNKIKVFGCGNLSARIAIVGEGPGKDEVAELTPFVGQAGKLLNDILLAIDLKRSDLYFTNAVLCRTGDTNRTPTKEEYSNCRKRLFEELTIVKPKFTLLLGSVALKSVMGSDNYKISECHGKWFTHLNEPCYFYYSLYHPAWILHSQSDEEERGRKKVYWNDMKKLRDDMESLGEMFNDRGEVDDFKRECRESTPFEILH